MIREFMYYPQNIQISKQTIQQKNRETGNDMKFEYIIKTFTLIMWFWVI